MKTNPNDPAFPEPSASIPAELRGLTKREYFAAMAMAGVSSDTELTNEQVVRCSVRCADALIAELNKGAE